MTTLSKTIRNWGWGDSERRYDPVKRDRFLDLLATDYGLLPSRRRLEPLPMSEFAVPRTKLASAFLKRWRGRGLSVERTDRILHACGKSYRDLVRMRDGSLERYPDAVLHLREAGDLDAFFADAAAENLSCVPFGGGTGVVGGTECVGGDSRPVVVIDTKALNALVSFDETSRTATFQAGILGPALEQTLNSRGFTLGHFPQSFEFSTLGGWVATRSAGQNSTKYGKIEHLVQSLTIHAPAGVIRTHAVPASATGPSFKELLVGSEGIYGVITEATLRVSPLPERERFLPVYFKTFEEGARVFRRLMQAGLKPSVLRLSDPGETGLFSKLAMTTVIERFAAPLWLRLNGLGEDACFALIAFEGGRHDVPVSVADASRLIREGGGVILNKNVGEKWKKERFDLPYLRDDLMDRGYFIDTLETAASWSKIQAIYDAMRDAFSEKRYGEKIVFGAHISHAYPDGASLYFTFIGAQERGAEIKQWERVKSTATEIIMDGGGALSHHHGIGSDHRRWMGREHSELTLRVFKGVKKNLDPQASLNPGKVI